MKKVSQKILDASTVRLGFHLKHVANKEKNHIRNFFDIKMVRADRIPDLLIEEMIRP